MIKKNRGIITEAIMKRWIEDNYHKNYIEKKKGCDLISSKSNKN